MCSSQLSKHGRLRQKLFLPLSLSDSLAPDLSLWTRQNLLPCSPTRAHVYSSMRHDIDRTVLEKELAQTSSALAKVELGTVGRSEEKGGFYLDKNDLGGMRKC